MPPEEAANPEKVSELIGSLATDLGLNEDGTPKQSFDPSQRTGPDDPNPNAPPAEPPAEPPPQDTPAAPPAEPPAEPEFNPDDLFGNEEPPPETPPEPTDLSDEEVDSLDEKVKQSFIHLRQQVKELKEQKPAEGTSEEAELLRKQLQERDSLIGRLRIEEHPEFKRQFVAPIQNIVQSSQGMLRELEVDPSVFATALRMPLREQAEYLEEHAPQISNVLMNNIAQIKQVVAAKETAMKDQGALMQRLNIHQVQQETKLKEDVFNAVVDDLGKNGHFFLVKSPGKEKKNKMVDTVLERAKQNVMAADPRDQAAALVMAAEVPELMQMIKTLSADNTKMREQLGIKERGTPRVSASRPSAPTQGTRLDKNGRVAPMSGGDILDGLLDKKRRA